MRGDERRESEVASRAVSPIEVEIGDMDEEDFEEIKCEESEERQERESEEAREPIVLRDPGAPSPQEVEQHDVTHTPFRSWCPHCVNGKAKDRHHKKQLQQNDEQIPEIVFDYCFLGWDKGEETLAVLVARDRRTQMIFSHVVPRKGMINNHASVELEKDIEKLGYNEIILKGDNEQALKSIQEEVKMRRKALVRRRR